MYGGDEEVITAINRIVPEGLAATVEFWSSSSKNDLTASLSLTATRVSDLDLLILIRRTGLAFPFFFLL
jgi:hypothetical protein